MTEISLIKDKLNKKGFFKVSHQLKKQSNLYICRLNLGKKITIAVINDGDNPRTLNVPHLEEYILSKQHELDKKGESFSEIKLSNITIRKDTLFARLYIKRRQIRYIDKIIIKGYKDFPTSYLKNFLNIKKKTAVSKGKLKHLSEQLKTLEFVTETKPPQLLFSKDSTFIFFYLKKKSKNYFDGFINASPRNNTIKFNGQLSLGLSNIFNQGESFNLNWNSNTDNTSFNINIKTPFLFNSPITPELIFNIFKQDSTFLNSEVKTKLSYQISAKSIISINYESNTSSNLLDNEKTNVNSFTNSFYGLSYRTTIKDRAFAFSEDSFLKTSLLFGSRNSNNTKANQIKFIVHAQHLQKLSNKGSLLLQSQIGYLESDSYLENELFRIGGPLSIRGFLPNSIPSSKYLILKTQYNYLINEKTQIYPLFDLAQYYFNKSNNLLSTGIGYSQLRNNTLINIEYAIGKGNQESFNFNNSFLSIKVLTYF
ncbi:hypothetical protein SAMN04489761_1757 [Tenacibaculum sp. MAR_2009_124]|uniref:hypothetical protein n=1 Tax=Tenacibaculum sp. MAR_2009_124 TaxID=1250059 RepID=UPI00089D2661|nr:hypothetical protein [Tenacibaculum sp. MAR_2009_124]SEB78351.1 hypothetical protein SAMN04489761_1757 [Tenacibaculum sp. MAR_2009_124]